MPRVNKSMNLSDYSRSRRWELLKRIENTQLLRNQQSCIGGDEINVMNRQTVVNADNFSSNQTSHTEDRRRMSGQAEAEHLEIEERNEEDDSSADEEIIYPRNVNENNGHEIQVEAEGSEHSGIEESDNGDDSSNDEEINHSRNDNSSDEDDDYENDNDDNADDEDDNDVDDEDPFIYENASLKLSESMLAIFMYAIKYNLTGTAFADLLMLIPLHLPNNSPHKRTVYKFEKHFNGSEVPLKKHFYCSECTSDLASKNSVCGCSNDTRSQPENAYFIEIPIVDQLQQLLMQPGFVGDLSYKNNRIKESDDNIEDIYDGMLYKEYMRARNPNSDDYHLTFMWYTDGVPIFKSAKSSAWPFYLIINELPYEKRIMKENMILVGLWFGSSDPEINSFLRPIYSQMAAFNAGVNLNVLTSTNSQIVKASILCGTCDAVARAKFLNHIQFNGDYGCPRCYSKGYTIREEGVHGNTHIYPFEGDLMYRNIRTYNNLTETVIATQRTFYGIKGPTILSKLMPNIIRGTAIDVMHNVYLGVTKYLIKLLFDGAYRYKPWSMYNYGHIVDERLKKINPPSFIKRMPRTLTKHSNYWKASEWKYFLFFYSLPIFEDLMEEKYFWHYSELVLGIYLLNQKSIEQEDLDLSKKLLTAFVAKFQTLYNPQFVSFNIHCLLHLPEAVQDLGPLWVTSCFPFEDILGKIKTHVHGTRYIGLQIYSKISHHSIAANKLRVIDCNSDVFKYCNKLKTIGKRVNPLRRIAPSTYALGKMVFLNNIPQNLQLALQNVPELSNRSNFKVSKFLRLKIKSQTIYSQCYRRKTASDSYCVKVMSEQGPKIGYVDFFIKVCNCITINCELNCMNSKFYAVFQEIIGRKSFKFFSALNVIETVEDNYSDNITYVDIPYVWNPVSLHPSKTLISVNSIINLCFIVKVSGKLYIAEPDNNIEYCE